MRIWQKYVVLTVKNHKHIQKLHLLVKISEINHKLLTSSETLTFPVHPVRVWQKLYSRSKYA